jgi:hypothetical protein
MLHIPRVVIDVARSSAELLLMPPVDGTIIGGRSLANKLPHLSKVERAFLAADLHNGNLKSVSLTLGQAAALTRVSVDYVRAAVAASDVERLDILTGACPLIRPKASDTALVELAKTVGADRWLSAGIAAGL